MSTYCRFVLNNLSCLNLKTLEHSTTITTLKRPEIRGGTVPTAEQVRQKQHGKHLSEGIHLAN